jgi:DNA-binding transcriptional LysR family regulator
LLFFERTGGRIAPTDAGRVLYNASHLSTMNIAEAVHAVRCTDRQASTVCVSRTFSLLWLSTRLPSFREQFPHIRPNVVATDNFMEFDALVDPDIVISRNPPRDLQYETEPLFHDVVYPVCSPSFHARHFRGKSPKPLDLLAHTTLDLSSLGRAQVCEHVDCRSGETGFSARRHGREVSRSVNYRSRRHG